MDQLFSEEQFDVYRALGFHAAYGFFAGRDAFAHRDPRTKEREAYVDKVPINFSLVGAVFANQLNVKALE